MSLNYSDFMVQLSQKNQTLIHAMEKVPTEWVREILSSKRLLATVFVHANTDFVPLFLMHFRYVVEWVEGYQSAGNC